MRSVEMLTRHLGPTPASSATRCTRSRSRSAASVTASRRVDTSAARSSQRAHPRRGQPHQFTEWRGLGECALDGARPQEALAHFTRALALAATGDNPLVLLFARFHVATARGELGERRAARAEVLAVQAALPDHDLNVEPTTAPELSAGSPSTRCEAR